MAGRRQFDADAALDRAMRVFWQRGYADASLDALVAATGLGRGSLYGAFGNKDELFRRCLDRYSAQHGARCEQALAAHPGDPVRAVQAFFDVTLARIADPSVPAGCLVAQSAAQTPQLARESAARVRELLDRQRRRVRAALDTGRAATSDESSRLDGASRLGGAHRLDGARAPGEARPPDEARAPGEARALDELAGYVVAVNQSLAVLSRAGATEAELRPVARLACGTVAAALGRAPAGTA